MAIPKVLCAFDEMVKTAKLKPNPRNPNHHSDSQVALIAKVIAGDGWRHPITVSERSGCIVAGHGRLLAAQKLGLSEVPVDYQPFASEQEELAALVADNRLAELAELCLPDVRDILLELDTGEMDMEMTGWSEEEMERLMTSTPMLEVEKTEELKPFKKVHILLSCSVDDAATILPEITEIADRIGVKVMHGSN